MSSKYRTTDRVTHDIFEGLVEDEVDDEEREKSLARLGAPDSIRHTTTGRAY